MGPLEVLDQIQCLALLQQLVVVLGDMEPLVVMVVQAVVVVTPTLVAQEHQAKDMAAEQELAEQVIPVEAVAALVREELRLVHKDLQQQAMVVRGCLHQSLAHPNNTLAEVVVAVEL